MVEKCELIFTMLGEATTRNKAAEKDAQGVDFIKRTLLGQNFKQQIKEAKKKQKELKKGEEEL